MNYDFYATPAIYRKDPHWTPVWIPNSARRFRQTLDDPLAARGLFAGLLESNRRKSPLIQLALVRSLRMANLANHAGVRYAADDPRAASMLPEVTALALALDEAGITHGQLPDAPLD